MKETPAIALILTIICLVLIPSEFATAQYKIKVGEPHPDFLLPRIDNGEPMSPKSFLGKKVLLINFASW